MLHYYYETTTENKVYRRRIEMTTQGHLILKETDKNFLCGKTKPTHEFRKLFLRRMPGRKLCENCTSERVRTKNELRAQAKLKNWRA